MNEQTKENAHEDEVRVQEEPMVLPVQSMNFSFGSFLDEDLIASQRRRKNENFTAKIYSTFLSKITMYNRIHMQAIPRL